MAKINFAERTQSASLRTAATHLLLLTSADVRCVGRGAGSGLTLRAGGAVCARRVAQGPGAAKRRGTFRAQIATGRTACRQASYTRQREARSA